MLPARVVKLADTLALEASAERRGGSSPSASTNNKKLLSELFLFGAFIKAKREAFCTLRRDLNAGSTRVPTCGRVLRRGRRRFAKRNDRRPSPFLREGAFPKAAINEPPPIISGLKIAPILNNTI